MTAQYRCKWDEIEGRVRALRESAKAQIFQGIIGVSRGGLVPAVMLSHYLKLPLLGVITAKAYTTENKLSGQVLIHPSHPLVPLEHQHKYLIVDDLYDTGVTADAIYQLHPHCTYAFLYRKSMIPLYMKHLPTEEKDPDIWIKFPWELN